MINTSFANGFLLGLSLILVIGAQNSFVIRQGLARNYIVLIVIFCALADTFLIFLGISGIGVMTEKYLNSFREWLFILAAAWIAWYGLCHLKNVFKSFDQNIQTFKPEALTVKQTLNRLIILTFLNPHVYLDTVLLIGFVSLQYTQIDRWIFGCGASFASVIFFCTLGYGASAISSYFNYRLAWRVLDALIASVMFFISCKLVFQSGLI